MVVVVVVVVVVVFVVVTTTVEITIYGIMLVCIALQYIVAVSECW